MNNDTWYFYTCYDFPQSKQICQIVNARKFVCTEKLLIWWVAVLSIRGTSTNYYCQYLKITPLFMFIMFLCLLWVFSINASIGVFIARKMSLLNTKSCVITFFEHDLQWFPGGQLLYTERTYSTEQTSNHHHHERIKRNFPAPECRMRHKIRTSCQPSGSHLVARLSSVLVI